MIKQKKSFYFKTKMNSSNKFDIATLDYSQNVGKIILFILICTVTIIGNLFIILLIKVEPRLKSVSNYLIINLAIADAGVGFTCQPFLALWETYNIWPYDDRLCDLWISFDYLFSSSSFLSMYAISMDRYWSLIVETKLDINRNLNRSRKRAFTLIFLTWIIPLTIWVPSVFVNRKIYGPSFAYDCNYKANSVFITICCILFYYLPMFAMLFFYSKIYTQLNSQMKKLSNWLIEMDMQIFRSMSNSNITSEVATNTNMSLLSNVNCNYVHPPYKNKVTLDVVTPTLKRRPNRLFKFNTKQQKTNNNSILTSSFKQSTSIGRTSSSFDIFNEFRKLRSFRISSKLKASDANFKLKMGDPTLRLIDINKRPLNYMNSNTKNNFEKNNNSNYRRRTINLKRHSSYNPDTYFKPIAFTAGLCSIGNPKVARKINATSRQNQQKLRLVKQQRVARMIGVLIFVFLICWMPFCILTPIQVFCKYCLSKRLHYNIIWCKYLNSSINPLLYMLANKVKFIFKFKNSNDYLFFFY